MILQKVECGTHKSKTSGLNNVNTLCGAVSLRDFGHRGNEHGKTELYLYKMQKALQVNLLRIVTCKLCTQ